MQNGTDVVNALGLARFSFVPFWRENPIPECQLDTMCKYTQHVLFYNETISFNTKHTIFVIKHKHLFYYGTHPKYFIINTLLP